MILLAATFSCTPKILPRPELPLPESARVDPTWQAVQKPAPVNNLYCYTEEEQIAIENAFFLMQKEIALLRATIETYNIEVQKP